MTTFVANYSIASRADKFPLALTRHNLGTIPMADSSADIRHRFRCSWLPPRRAFVSRAPSAHETPEGCERLVKLKGSCL